MPLNVKATTQNHLDILTVRDGLVLLKDGGVRLILSTTAVNFDLFSSREQDAAIDAYSSLLNSLSFQIQILIRSKKMDISQYFTWLGHQRLGNTNPKRKKEISEYESYIKQIIAKNEVLDKRFYVIIPYNQISLKPKKSLIDIVLGREPKPKISISQKALIKKASLELEPKREHLTKQFARIGIKAVQLGDQELVELFYSIYNPDISRVQKVGDTADRETVIVASRKGEDTM